MSPADSTAERLRRRLRRTYFILGFPPAAGILIIELIRDLGDFDRVSLPGTASLEIPIFVLSAATALALPILYRTLFASAHRQRTAVSIEPFFRFENNSTALALITPWCAVLSSLFAFDAFYATGIMLLTLYAYYFFYPSQKRVVSDMRIFRVTS